MGDLDQKSYRCPAEISIYNYLHSNGIAPIEVSAFLADSRKHHCHTMAGAESVPQTPGAEFPSPDNLNQRFANIQIPQRQGLTGPLESTSQRQRLKKVNKTILVSDDEDNSEQAD